MHYLNTWTHTLHTKLSLSFLPGVAASILPRGKRGSQFASSEIESIALSGLTFCGQTPLPQFVYSLTSQIALTCLQHVLAGWPLMSACEPAHSKLRSLGHKFCGVRQAVADLL